MIRIHALMAGLAASALLAACDTIAVPGFGDGSGCRTIYVYRTNGGIQPISNCGGLPRDTLLAKVAPQSVAPQSAEAAQPLQEGAPAAPAAAVVTPISAAAKATSPYDPPATPYPGPNEMLERGDMAAFMTRVRTDYAKKD